MLDHLPLQIPVAFCLTTLATVFIFCICCQKHHRITTGLILMLWIITQSAIGLTGFYSITNTLLPRVGLLLIPTLACIVILFLSPSGKKYLSQLDTAKLTLIHLVRIPVEIILFWLYQYQAVPEIMTFEGYNFDIVSGITAPIVYYMGYVKQIISPKILLGWNVLCLCLLINIVVIAIASAPTPLQQFAFGQPNVAVLYFPYLLLPGCVVPLVLLAHLAAIRKLISNSTS